MNFAIAVEGLGDLVGLNGACCSLLGSSERVEVVVLAGDAVGGEGNDDAADWDRGVDRAALCGQRRMRVDAERRAHGVRSSVNSEGDAHRSQTNHNHLALYHCSAFAQEEVDDGEAHAYGDDCDGHSLERAGEGELQIGMRSTDGQNMCSIMTC